MVYCLLPALLVYMGMIFPVFSNTPCHFNTFTASVRYTCILKSCVSCYFRVPLQLHNLPADCAKKLFKSLKDAVNLLVCIKKNWKVLDFSFLWVTS